MTTPAVNLRPGDQLASSVCTTRVVVIRAPEGRRPLSLELLCTSSGPAR
jgi:hypothetical protein